MDDRALAHARQTRTDVSQGDGTEPFRRFWRSPSASVRWSSRARRALASDAERADPGLARSAGCQPRAPSVRLRSPTADVASLLPAAAAYWGCVSLDDIAVVVGDVIRRPSRHDAGPHDHGRRDGGRLRLVRRRHPGRRRRVLGHRRRRRSLRSVDGAGPRVGSRARARRPVGHRAPRGADGRRADHRPASSRRRPRRRRLGRGASRDGGRPVRSPSASPASSRPTPSRPPADRADRDRRVHPPLMDRPRSSPAPTNPPPTSRPSTTSRRPPTSPSSRTSRLSPSRHRSTNPSPTDEPAPTEPAVTDELVIDRARHDRAGRHRRRPIRPPPCSPPGRYRSSRVAADRRQRLITIESPVAHDRRRRVRRSLRSARSSGSTPRRPTPRVAVAPRGCGS